MQASMVGDICLIKYPQSWRHRKKRLTSLADQVFWRLMAKIHQAQLEQRTHELNQLYFQFDYHDVRYHRQFRRWGSCSTLKNINLSHRLIGASQHLADYVIIHELAHLKHLNHRKEFWTLVNTTGVKPQLIKKEIEAYGYWWQGVYFQWYQKLNQSL